ncbi:MAG TPA: hypothetical protein PKA77_15485 [Chitinophagaceae bacterium]|jgi:hypothetical protein|nr:hypothetical protein [Chitinophagaceae bacterium]HMU59577.1 hypothetical protein [Chitinophagaceae bacterium]
MKALKKGTTIPRHQFVPVLVQGFIEAYRLLVGRYKEDLQLELTEHLLYMLGYMKEAAMSPEETGAEYMQLKEREEALLQKHGRVLKPYRELHFEKYLSTDILLVEKEVITTEEYNGLPAEEQGLTQAEVLRFVRVCSQVLDSERQLLLLNREPEAEVKQAGAVESGARENTQSRQLLALHYLLQAGFGIEPRSTVSVSSLARLAHLLTGTGYSSLQNSELYKKYLQMPNFKKGSALIADLRYIRSHFEEMGIQEAVKQIDAEIQREQKEQKSKEKRS